MADRPALILYYDRAPMPYYWASCKYGYEGHELPAMAIWRMHDHVPASAKPVQVLIYSTDFEGGATPERLNKDGSLSFPNNAKYRLVGLTMTGKIFKQRPQ